MPKPTADYFARLGALVAIDDAASRPTRPVLEAFSGTEMATIPVATADDLEVAVAAEMDAVRPAVGGGDGLGPLDGDGFGGRHVTHSRKRAGSAGPTPPRPITSRC